MPHAIEVLLFLQVFNTCELGLEIECVTHLVEQEGQEEVADAVVESQEASVLDCVETLDEAIAIWERVSDGTTDDLRRIKVYFEVARLGACCHVDFVDGQVVRIVGLAVKSIDDIADAQVAVVVGFLKFHTNDEGVELSEFL